MLIHTIHSTYTQFIQSYVILQFFKNNLYLVSDLLYFITSDLHFSCLSEMFLKTAHYVLHLLSQEYFSICF